ncbi:MAG TPA: glycosyltransferase [Mucilaginibacter sp.]|nr:glycosyltransferase [Mucilaginibacter sp.]
MLACVDIIILSFGKTEALQATTRNAIASLLASEDPEKIKFNVVVIESEQSLHPYQYPGTKTIYPATKFGYGKFMNIGIKATSSPYVCLCNNDLIFHKHWAGEIIRAMDNDPAMLSASAYDDNFHYDEGLSKFQPPLEGYMDILSPWCIFLKREIFDIIGPLDEKILFWYFDDDYCQTIIKHNVKNCLVSSSFVTHLGSSSLKTLDNAAKKKLTKLPEFYYRYKWEHGSYFKYKSQLLKFKLKMALGLD